MEPPRQSGSGGQTSLVHWFRAWTTGVSLFAPKPALGALQQGQHILITTGTLEEELLQSSGKLLGGASMAVTFEAVPVPISNAQGVMQVPCQLLDCC